MGAMHFGAFTLDAAVILAEAGIIGHELWVHCVEERKINTPGHARGMPARHAHETWPQSQARIPVP